VSSAARSLEIFRLNALQLDFVELERKYTQPNLTTPHRQLSKKPNLFSEFVSLPFRSSNVVFINEKQLEMFISILDFRLKLELEIPVCERY
jgi:hypothetical protein